VYKAFTFLLCIHLYKQINKKHLFDRWNKWFWHVSASRVVSKYKLCVSLWWQRLNTQTLNKCTGVILIITVMLHSVN